VTTPVATDDVVSGAARYLLDQAALVAVVGESGDPPTPLIAQDVAPAASELAQATAVVVAYGGGWAGANIANVLRFPRLRVEIWADPIRDSNGRVVEQAETRRRLMACADVVDGLLHRAQGGEIWWGDVRVLDSVRLGEITVDRVPGGDGLLRGQVFYAVTVG